MFVLFERVEYCDGTITAQLCGTFNYFEEAHSLMYWLYHDELASDEMYDEEYCEIRDDRAILSGENKLPRQMEWYVFDSDSPEQISW